MRVCCDQAYTHMMYCTYFVVVLHLSFDAIYIIIIYLYLQPSFLRNKYTSHTCYLITVEKTQYMQTILTKQYQKMLYTFQYY